MSLLSSVSAMEVNGCRQNESDKNITVHQLTSEAETNPALRRL